MAPVETIEVALPTLELPAEDGIPLETSWHRADSNLFIVSIRHYWRERIDWIGILLSLLLLTACAGSGGVQGNRARGEAALKQGMDFHDEEALEQAAAEYEKVLQQDPGQPQLHLTLGEIYNRLYRFEKAMAASRNALELDPTLAQAHLHLGNAHCGLNICKAVVIAYFIVIIFEEVFFGLCA